MSPRHSIYLRRETVERLTRRLWEKSTMADSARASREFNSYYQFFRSALAGRSSQVEIKQSITWLRFICRITGDTEAAFEIAMQLHVEIV